MQTRMLKATLIGAATAVALSYASRALNEHIAGVGENIRLVVASSSIQSILSLLPGLIAGWFAGRRGILAGFLAALIGNIVYSAAFGTFWGAVVADGARSVLYTALWLCLMAVSWALTGAASGGAAQLLRTNRQEGRAL
jgi:hypothetical protein